MMKNVWMVAMAVVVCGMSVSCAKKQMVKPVDVEEFVVDADEPDIRGKEYQRVADIATVYFDYNASDLRADARAALKVTAEYLKAHADLEALIEGHCDDRGTLEYNMALGQRRAAAVRSYYIKLGVSADRLATISYGEERPAAVGSFEAAWAKNRRGETLVRRR